MESAAVTLRMSLLVSFVVAICVGTTAASANDVRIISWSVEQNTLAWNRALHVGSDRMGCNASPEDCVARADHIAAKFGIENVSISIPMDLQRSLRYASEFNSLGSESSVVREVGFDDFYSQYGRLPKSKRGGFH